MRIDRLVAAVAVGALLSPATVAAQNSAIVPTRGSAGRGKVGEGSQAPDASNAPRRKTHGPEMGPLDRRRRLVRANRRP